MKQYETTQLNVKVTNSTADQIRLMAASNHITVAEQIRQFIDKGLKIDGNAKQIDFITNIIRQEFMKQKNSTVNEILQDGIYTCRTAD